MSAMASPYDVDPAVGAHVLPRAKDLLRSHAGQDEHDPQLVLQARVDRRAPDDSRVRRNATLDDFGDLLGLGDAHVVPARDVHEGSGRGADVDVDQGRIDRLFDRLFRAVVTIGFAQADHRDPAALHDRLDVVEVQVNEAGLRDDLRDSFDRPHQHIVRDLERRIQRQTRDEFKEFVIRDHDDRVREVAEFLEAILGVLGSDRSLGPEGERADRDREGARLLRQLREDRGAACAGAASEAARDEDHVRPLDDGPEFVRRFAGGLLADLGECPGPEAPRDPASQEELVRRPDDQEMLGVRVRGEELRPDDAGLDEPVDRVAAAPSNADDLDVRPQAGEDPLEFGVLRADAHRLRGGFREPRLNARTTHDFPDNGIHFSASGCPRKRMKQPRHSRKGGRLINVSGFAPSSSPPVDRHGGNSADYIDADAGLLLRGISSPDNLFRLDAGRDEHDAQRVFERRVDGRAPDDSRRGGDLRLDDLGDALRLGNRHVVPARDVDQDAVGGRHIDLEERRIDRLFDRLDGAVVADGLALAKADHRDAAAFHDRFDIIEVEVHEAGLRDDLRESLDRPHEHLVRELEREVQRLTRYQVQQFVVRDRDHRVGRVSEPLEAPFRALHPEFPFASERQGHNRDRQGAHLLREPGDVAAAAGARPATQAAGHEHDVRALDDRAQLLFGLARGFLADLWQRAGPEAFRNPTTEQDLLRGGDMEQVLRVRVASVQLGPDDPLVVAAAGRVAAATTEADNLDVRPHLAEHLFELGVDPAVFKCGGTPFAGENVL